VIFDRIRENESCTGMNLYDVTNLSINQTLSRTVITSGLVFLSVVSLVLLGGETLRPFSLALLMGIVFGTYDTIARRWTADVWWRSALPLLSGPRLQKRGPNFAKILRAPSGLGMRHEAIESCAGAGTKIIIGRLINRV